MNNMKVSLSPHEKGHFTTNKIMWLVCAALIPSFISALYNFGIRALVVVAASLVFCVGIEYLIQKFLLKTKVTVRDGSAAVTGLLLAFNMPSSIPLWQLFIGALVAIGIAKMAFGGLGKNPFNPALVGRAFLLISFPVSMTTWPKPGETRLVWNVVDAMTAATPLGNIKLHAFNQLPAFHRYCRRFFRRNKCARDTSRRTFPYLQKDNFVAHPLLFPCHDLRFHRNRMASKS